jgi:hypothetical protein
MASSLSQQVLTQTALETAWAAVVAEFALPASERRAERRDGALLTDLDVADPVAEHVVESGWPNYGYEKGMLYVECPNADGHSSDNGETQTAWLLAGTGKYRHGHFRCMHAGCAEITDARFFEAVGYRPAKVSDFEDETDAQAAVDLYVNEAPTASAKSKELKAEARLPLPGFDRDGQGRIETNLKNVLAGSSAPQAVGVYLVHDRLREELMIAEQRGEWQRFKDADAVRLRIALEDLGFKNPIGRELMRDALAVLADEQQFDSAEEWVMRSELKPGGVPAWDGVKRIERFYPDYLNTEDTPYTRALGEYVWSAHAGRVLDPGCQVDMVPVMVSPEGYAKTSVVRAIAPAPEFFSEFSFDQDEKERTRLMVGCLVGELAELRGIGARDGEAIKSWITRRVEEWVPKYMERKTAYPRRLVFHGTTNDENFLKPHMGERRWLPVRILRPVDISKIERDRLQLWAEARDHYLVDGIAWQKVSALAEAERGAFKDEDVWLVRIGRWLDEPIGDDGVITPRTCGELRTEDVARDCLGIEARNLKRGDEMRIAEVLRALGMVGTQKRVNGQKARFWVPNVPT